MRILIVNNETKRMGELKTLLKEHTIIERHFLEVNKPINADLIVLTGSHVNSVLKNKERFAAELDLIKNTRLPLIGICLGFELIAHAYNIPLLRLENKIEGFHEIEVLNNTLFDGRTKFTVYEAHRWVAPELPSDNEIKGLARSARGWEIIKHKNRHVYGLQFHPEVTEGGNQDGSLLFEAILAWINAPDNDIAKANATK